MYFRRNHIDSTIEIVGKRPEDFDKLRTIFGLYVPELLCYLQHVSEDTEGKVEVLVEVLAEGIPFKSFVNVEMLKFLQPEWQYIVQKSKENRNVLAQ